MSVQFQEENTPSYIPTTSFASPEDDQPFVIRTVMKGTGGLIKTPKQAQIVLLILSLAIVGVAFLATYKSTRYKAPSATSHEEQERAQLKHYIETHPESNTFDNV